jgi:membrane protein DedA with SNARE-associated domain
MVGMWKAIPLGFLLKLPPLYIFLMVATGSVLGVLILFFFGTKIRNYIINRQHNKGGSKKERKALELLDKYGLIGLGFFGTLIFGPPMPIVLGMTLVKRQKHFLYWTLAGTIVWSLVLTILGTLSIDIISRFA